MPIPIDMMKAAVQTGLSVVCASCERYWEGRDLGRVGDQCVSHSKCGSPLVGDTFSEYRGVMTESVFQRCCFICGGDAAVVIEVSGRTRRVGVCSDHAGWLKEVSPVFIGETVPSPEFVLPPRGTLLGEIVRTEQEWADRKGEAFDPRQFLAGKNGDPDAS